MNSKNNYKKAPEKKVTVNCAYLLTTPTTCGYTYNFAMNT